MKKVLLVFTLLFALGECDAQPFAIANSQSNLLFVNKKNRVTITVANTPCNNLKIVVPQGKVVSTEKPCEYIIEIARPGSEVIEIYNKQTGKLIGKETQRVLYPSEKLDVKMGHVSAQAITKETLLRFSYVYVTTDIDYDHGYVVDSYKLIIVREGKMIFYNDSNGVEIDEAIHTAFETVLPGDKVILYDIKVKKEGMVEPYNNAKVYTIK